MIVQPTWHTFFDKILMDISEHFELQGELFDTEANFFAEEVKYRDLNKETV